MVNLNVIESNLVPLVISLSNSSYHRDCKNTNFKKSLKLMHLVGILTIIAEMGIPVSLKYYHRFLDLATIIFLNYFEIKK